MPKYLLLARNSTEIKSPPSPEEMQALGAAWGAWMSKFRSAIVPGGDGLQPGGRVIRDGLVTDGPYVEGKEVIISFTLLQADDLDAALAIARECPGGLCFEVRELAGYA